MATSDKTRELAKGFWDTIPTLHSDEVQIARLVALLDDFERETQLNEHRRTCDWPPSFGECLRCIALGDPVAVEAASKRIAALAQPTPEVKDAQ